MDRWESTISYAAITNPTDGTPVPDDIFNKNVIYGIHNYTINGLAPNTTYYFKIYSYTNSGTDINYKCDGIIQITAATTSIGTSILQPGDVAVIEVNTIDVDRISFITFKQLSAGTVINFTDNGFVNANTVRTGEGVITYTAPATIPAGTVISWYYGMDVTGTGWNTGTPGTFSLSASGDEVFAYQGTWGSGQSLIFGIQTASASWLTSGTATSQTSYLPSSLTNNVNALCVNATNCNYSLISTGTVNALGSLIANEANWTKSSSALVTPSWNFSLADGTSIIQNATVQNLKIGSGETLNIPAGKQLTVSGTLSNNAGTGGLVINSDATGTGSLIHNSDFVPAKVNRYFTGANYTWHLLSSPVSETIAGTGFVPTASDYAFFCWDEPSAFWINYKNSTTEPTWVTVNGSDFIPGRGYLVAYNETNPTKQFEGLLNNGQVDFDLNYSGTGAWLGYNLAGNPYPSAIDWKSVSGWSRSNLSPSAGGYNMWIWNAGAGNYGAFNSAGSTGTNSVTQYIPVGQGFFVQATAAGSFSMTNSVRINETPSFLKSSEDLSNVLRLKVANSSNSYSDEVVIEFGHGPEIGGTPKRNSIYTDAPGLYMLKNNERYSVELLGHLTRQTESLCLLPGTSGNFTLSAELLNSFAPGISITLEDLRTGESQDLTKTPQYLFTAATGDESNRFLIHFDGTIGIAEDAQPSLLKLFARNQEVVFEMPAGIKSGGEVSVYNLLGQQILNRKITPAIIQTLPMNNEHGYFLVRLVTREGSFSGKVLLN